MYRPDAILLTHNGDLNEIMVTDDVMNDIGLSITETHSKISYHFQRFGRHASCLALNASKLRHCAPLKECRPYLLIAA